MAKTNMNRAAAKWRSSERNGIQVVSSHKTEAQIQARRKKSAEKLKQQRSTPAGRKKAASKFRDKLAEANHARKVGNRYRAKEKSNKRTGISGYAPRGSDKRKAKAAEFKAGRATKSANAKAGAGVMARDQARVNSNARRTFATVELARTLKARGYSVRIKRGKGVSLVNGYKSTASGRSINIHAQGTGRKMTKGAWGGTVINRNTKVSGGMMVGYQRLVNNPAKPKGPGIRTAKQGGSTPVTKKPLTKRQQSKRMRAKLDSSMRRESSHVVDPASRKRTADVLKSSRNKVRALGGGSMTKGKERLANRSAARVKSSERHGISRFVGKGSTDRLAKAATLKKARTAWKSSGSGKNDNRFSATVNSNLRHGLKTATGSMKGWGALGIKKGSAQRRAVAQGIKGQRSAKQKAASIANLQKGRASRMRGVRRK